MFSENNFVKVLVGEPNPSEKDNVLNLFSGSESLEAGRKGCPEAVGEDDFVDVERIGGQVSENDGMSCPGFYSYRFLYHRFSICAIGNR